MTEVTGTAETPRDGHADTTSTPEPGFTPEHKQLTEDPHGAASGPHYVTQGLPRVVWVAVGPDTALRWERSPASNWGYAEAGLLMYGPVTRQRLQELNLPEARTRPIQGNMNPDPPSPEQLRDLWERTQPTPPEHFQPKRRGEPAQDFYERVAAHYRLMLQHRPAAPVQALAEAAEVPHYKATNWVSEARRRGTLPPARRNKQ